MTKSILTAISYYFLRILSFLPFALLNAIGSFVFFLLDKVIHYRKKIILRNLRNAFPQKSDEELKRITTGFYRYFSRLLIENVKMFNLSVNELQNRIKLENPEVIENFFKEGSDIAVMAAHYGNWEWLLGLRKDIPHHCLGIYKSLNNKRFDNFFKSHRSRYGTEMVNMREVPRVLLKHSGNNLSTLTVFISDQSPVWEEIQYWTEFLNQETPVYLGAEKLAKKMKMAVVYFRVKVQPKNTYTVEAIPVTPDASKEEEFVITECYLKLLEEDIIREPEYWLWSHRRWKLTEKKRNLEKQGIYRFEGKQRKK